MDLALNQEKGMVSTNEIAARQEVSPKYLEHLLTSLRSAGLIRSARGARGGHTLTRPPNQINLREIYHVFEGLEGFVECTTSPDICDRTDICVTQEIWGQLYTVCLEVLESTTLEDLAHRVKDKQNGSSIE